MSLKASVWRRAEKLFKAFHNRAPYEDEIVEVSIRPTAALVVGELDGIIYRVKGERKGHIHRFNKSNRPVLLVSSDGSQAFILTGGYRFTDRGFIG